MGDGTGTGSTGAYQNYPPINGGGEMKNIKRGDFYWNVINKPFVDLANRLEEVLQQFKIDWGAILDLGGAGADAAAAYFEYKIENGGWIKNKGDNFKWLNRIFRPAPQYQILNCLNGVQWSKSTCTRRKFGICYSWSTPKITCGTSQCVKWC
ncbi:hypothetical protein B484DRAFT_444495 [Ochromonadaceae sp. CCMP2298]|nr:hypothetical protein B484DRAFT_444495 [Ochromonadaceae sp. CCMP2298]